MISCHLNNKDFFSIYFSPPFDWPRAHTWSANNSISFLEATILLVSDRDLWARLKARHKDGQIWLATYNQTGTRNSWFQFWIVCVSRPLVRADAGFRNEIANNCLEITVCSCALVSDGGCKWYSAHAQFVHFRENKMAARFLELWYEFLLAKIKLSRLSQNICQCLGKQLFSLAS